MIWNGVRNYLRGLKYAFVPLGTLFLGLILGFSVFLPRAAGEVKEFADGAAKVTGEGAVRYEELLDSLAARVLELDWDNPLAACAAMLDEGWINGTLEECVEPFVEEYDRYAESIKGLAMDAADGIAAAAAAVGIFAALGIAGGFFLTKWFLRRELAPRSFGKFIAGAVIDSVLAAVLLFVCVRLSVWIAGAYVSALAALLLFQAAALAEAYLLHARGKIPFRRAVTVKNCLKLAASDVLIYFAAAALVTVAGAVLNGIAALVLALPLFGTALLVIGMNAESYMIRAAEENEKD